AAADAPRLARIAGVAIDTTDPSTNTMLDPSTVAIRIERRATPEGTPPSAIGTRPRDLGVRPGPDPRLRGLGGLGLPAHLEVADQRRGPMHIEDQDAL